MMSYYHEVMQRLADTISRYERQIALLKRIKEDPELQSLLRPILSPLSTVSADTVIETPTQKQRVLDYFAVPENNQWQSIKHIAMKAGVSKEAVRNVLYKVVPDLFERRNCGPNRVEWKKKEAPNAH